MTSRQELKEKIIKELLPNLSVDPYGGYVNAEELSKHTYDSVEDYYFKIGANGEPKPISTIDPNRILIKDDYKEIRWALVEDIRKHASEWKIEPEGKLTIVKHISGKKHYKEGFNPHDWGEWAEIEKILSQVQQPSSQQPQQQAQQQSPKPNFPFFGSSDSNSKY